MPDVPEKVKKLIEKATVKSMWWHEFLSKFYMMFMIIVNIAFGLFVLFGGLRYALLNSGLFTLDMTTITEGQTKSVGQLHLEFYGYYDLFFSILVIGCGVWAIFVRKSMINRSKKTVGMLLALIEVSSLLWVLYFRVIQAFTLETVNTSFWGIMTLLYSVVMFIVNHIYYDKRTDYFKN